MSAWCSQILLMTQPIACRTLIEGSPYIETSWLIEGSSIWLKLGLSGPSVIVPRDRIAAYRARQSADVMLLETKVTT